MIVNLDLWAFYEITLQKKFRKIYCKPVTFWKEDWCTVIPMNFASFFGTAFLQNNSLNRDSKMLESDDRVQATTHTIENVSRLIHIANTLGNCWFGRFLRSVFWNIRRKRVAIYRLTNFATIFSWILPTEVLRKVSHQGRLPPGMHLFIVNHGNTGTMCEVCTKLAIKTPELRHWGLSSVFIVNFEQTSRIILLFLLLNLNK